ncbi:MAG: MMPL family transporter, partial [Cyclobacteriaceae bacterium]
MPRKYALLVLILILLASVWQVTNLRNLRFDYDFENFLPIGDPELDYYRYFRDNFESDNDYLLIGLTATESVLSEAFTDKLSRLTDSLEATDGVRSVISPANTGGRRMLPDGNVLVLPWLKNGGQSDSLRIARNRSLTWPFVDDEYKRVSLLVNLVPPNGKKASDKLVDAVYLVLDRAGFPRDEVAVAGKVRAQQHYVGLMQKEMPRLLGISIVVVLILLYMLYRSLWWICLPLAAVSLTVLWVLGFMAEADIPVDIMMVALPSILFVVATSDVIHLLTRYLAELRLNKPNAEALKVAFKDVGLATFLTSLTTAAGFLTLLTASIRPIRSFGVVAGAGVFVAFIVAFTLLPALLTILPRPSVHKAVKSAKEWQKRLNLILTYALKHRKLIIIGSVVITLLSVAGTSLIRTDSYLISDLPESDPLRSDFQFIDQHFGGSRTFEITFTTPDSLSLYDLQMLKALEVFEQDIARGPVRVIASPLLLAYATNQTLSGGDPQAFRLPKGEAELARFRKYISRASRSSKYPLEADSGNTYRISGRVADIGSEATLQEVERLRGAVEASDYGSLLSP